MKNYVGKIGYCSNADLKLKDKLGNAMVGGHYVFVRKENKNGTCSVSTFTSLENKGIIKQQKMQSLRNGRIYAFPRSECNFPHWTGLNRNKIVVKKNSIQFGNNKKIKRKHLEMFKKQ